MKLITAHAKNNPCYKQAKPLTPKGIVVHSTGVYNPYLKRYVDAPAAVGKNIYGNHWNTENTNVCVHAFIGKLFGEEIGTYQTLPWDMVGWHSGEGANGNANFMGYIGFEICEDDLRDRVYFEKVYREAVELCGYLCQQFDLTEKDIICHSEGHVRGIASNHAYVMHWFPKFGKNMDTFRAEVKAELEKAEKVILDNEAADWSKDSVNWAIKTGLLKGDEKGDLMLHSPVTREQLCVMLRRFLEVK